MWSVRTKASDATVSDLRALLSPEERQRAEKFHFDELRRAFVIRRGARRVLLAKYLGIPAGSVEFEHASNGKPSVSLAGAPDFNVSRSEGLAVFAFAQRCELGIDVERSRPIPDKHAIATRFFCAEEAAELMSLPADLHDHAFHLCWTRKEAYIKAIGQGLSAPLDEFRVTLRPGEPARFVHILHNPELAKQWVLHNLLVAPGYAAALAYQAPERPIRIFPVLEAAEAAAFLA